MAVANGVLPLASPLDPLLCVVCGQTGDEIGCSHTGHWHSRYGDCGPTCALRLGWSNLGRQHYGCCFSTSRDGPCKARAHVYGCLPGPDGSPSTASPLSAFTSSTPATSASSLRAPPANPEGLFGRSDCPRFRVNLDESPGTRWNHVVEAYRSELPAVLTMIDDVIGQGALASTASTIFSGLLKVGRFHYGEEIRGISKAIGLPEGKVAIMQIAYEVFACCTSIITNMNGEHIDPNIRHRVPYHIRTMDWEFSELSKLTIEVDFVKDGRVLYSGSTWPGYVGVLTGVRRSVASVAVNYRRSQRGAEKPVEGLVENMMRGLASSWPVSFLVREALESCESYEDFVGALQSSTLMAPTYLSVAGPEEGQGIVITRNRKHSPATNGSDGGGNDLEAHPPAQSLGPAGSVVQANMDHWRDPGMLLASCTPAQREAVEWQDIEDSVARRTVATQALAQLGSDPSPEDLWLLLSTPPVFASDTVYTTAMCAATGLLRTRATLTKEQKDAGKRRWGYLVAQLYQQQRPRSGPRRIN